MPIRVSNLRMHLHEPEANLKERLARALNLSHSDISQWRILRKSLDARKKNKLQFVYSAEVTTPPELETKIVQKRFRSDRNVQIEPYFEQPFQLPKSGQKPLEHPPVIIGSGPAGLAAGYFLASVGYQPIVLERGPAVRDRIKDVKAFDDGGPFEPESNYLFGEGGAGTFSDGKLTCRGSGPDFKRILRLFAENKGKPSVVYDYRPHLGSNRLPAVVKAIRRKIEEFSGEVRFGTKVEYLEIVDGRVVAVRTAKERIPCSVVLLATGHSARDTFSMLKDVGVPMVRKPFQMGLRIEQPQENVNRFQYGSNRIEEVLGAADYSLVARGPNDLFTFCMCAGGYVIPSVSEEGYFCTNGMSLSKRNSYYANSGLVVTVPLEHFGGEDVLAGVRLQQRFEKLAFALGGGEYRCPVQWAKDFLEQKASTGTVPSSYPRGVVPTDLHALVPDFIAKAFHHGLPILDQKWHGQFLKDAVLVGPEARGSSPIRMLRDDHSRESPGIDGLFPIGEGAGYAGGIVSAAVDGLRSAKAVIAKYAPLESK